MNEQSNSDNIEGGSLASNIQQHLIREAQLRLNNLMQLMMARRELRSPGLMPSGSDDFEDLMSRPFNQMFTRSLDLDRVERDITTTTTTEDPPTEPQLSAVVVPVPAESRTERSDMCLDIRGRDRACCNTALQCFDGLKSTLDTLETATNDFSLASACRVVSSELRKDKRCVQQSLSRCGGPGRLTLYSRFNNRIDNLYDQFYSHCKKDPSTINTSRVLNPRTTTLPPPPVRTPVTPHRPKVTTNSNVHWQTTLSPGGNQNYSGGSDVGIGNGLIIAGVITGGLLLTIMLLLVVFCWCKRRKDGNGSESSGTWVFFQNRPNLFSRDRSRVTNNNNNKALVRQESSIYAEIDESIVNPNYKPPAPPNASYISPISDDGIIPSVGQQHPTNSPAITTRGQMSYGPILAANNNSSNNNGMFYHSVSVTTPTSPNDTTSYTSDGTPGPRLPTRGYSSLANAHLRSDDNSYVTNDVIDSEYPDHDDYEEPISTQSSLQYTELQRYEPPLEQAPGVPTGPKPSCAGAKASPKPNVHPKNAVKVLPSNPLAPGASNEVAQPTPVAQPRRKKNGNNVAEPVKVVKDKKKDVASDELSNRDSTMSSVSTMSSKSSHHYFVLEKNQAMDYENSVSASKLV